MAHMCANLRYKNAIVVAHRKFSCSLLAKFNYKDEEILKRQDTLEERKEYENYNPFDDVCCRAGRSSSIELWPAGSVPAATGPDSAKYPSRPAGSVPAATGPDSAKYPSRPASSVPAATGPDSAKYPSRPASSVPAAAGPDSAKYPSRPASSVPAAAGRIGKSVRCFLEIQIF
jgi:hypothetical protein